ncbi:MAG: hypothetical protein RLZZ591_1419 [Pseudomonadota bacterium]|jgi:colicin import membrane protein
MNDVFDRNEFAPPPTPGLLRALALAVAAHVVLLVGLTAAVSWKREAVTLSAEAELWSSVPQEAAPKLLEPPPPPPPEPEVRPEPVKPPPVPKVAEPDINTEQLKKQKAAKEKERQEQLREQEKARLKAEQQEKADKLTKEKLALEKKKLQERELAAEKKKKDLEAKRKDAEKEQREAKLQEALRQENIKRMATLAGSAGVAGASGSANAKGTALQSSGPSASYGGRLRARIKPNIVFTDDIPGNPTADVEVRTAPDGTIIGRKLDKSSGNPAWDQAVLKAIDKTEVLPRDVDGTVPPKLVISFRPKD